MTSQEMDDLIAKMVREGLLCDSGLRRPDREGHPQIVWKCTPLGRALALIERAEAAKRP